jgi:hypothetical protein
MQVKRLGKLCSVLLVLSIWFVLPLSAVAADHGLSLGYGFGAFNLERPLGRVEGGKSYNFIQASYFYEKPLSSKELAFLIEPFSSYVNSPNSGVDVGFDLSLRYYPFKSRLDGFYLTLGPGMAYTSIGFKEQGTHLLFIVQGGVGYRYKNFFIEDRVRHYSNAGLAKPNWSVNANIFSIGGNF